MWVNIGSNNGLLADGTKPLLKPMLAYHQWCPIAFIHLKAISQEVFMNLICNMRPQITLLRLQPHLPGAKGLTCNNPLHWLPLCVWEAGNGDNMLH